MHNHLDMLVGQWEDISPCTLNFLLGNSSSLVAANEEQSN